MLQYSDQSEELMRKIPAHVSALNWLEVAIEEDSEQDMSFTLVVIFSMLAEMEIPLSDREDTVARLNEIKDEVMAQRTSITNPAELEAFVDMVEGTIGSINEV